MSVKITVDISEELRQQAKVAVALRGETISEVVRTALEAYVKETLTENTTELPEEWWKRDSLLSLAGRYASGSKDTAERAEEILEAAVDQTGGFSVKG